MPAKKWKHDELALDLAEHLRTSGDRMVWENMQMGSAGSARPDVYTLAKSFSKPHPATYEVKVSRADFLADCNEGKWQSYLRFSAGVFFAVPAGLVKKEEVPPGCGLIVRHDEIWRHVKTPRWSAYRIDGDVAMKLLIDGVPRLRAREAKPRSASLWQVSEQIRERMGERVAKCIRDLDAAEKRVEALNADAEKVSAARQAERDAIAKERTELRDEAQRLSESMYRRALAPLLRTLGLADDVSLSVILRAIGGAARALNRDTYVRYLEQQLDTLKRAFDAIERLPKPAKEMTT